MTDRTTIQLRRRTADRLRQVVARMRAEDPERIRTTDAALNRLLDRHDDRPTVSGDLDRLLEDWSRHISDILDKEVRAMHARAGERILPTVHALREKLAGQRTDG